VHSRALLASVLDDLIGSHEVHELCPIGSEHRVREQDQSADVFFAHRSKCCLELTRSARFPHDRHARKAGNDFLEQIPSIGTPGLQCNRILEGSSLERLEEMFASGKDPVDRTPIR